MSEQVDVPIGSVWRANDSFVRHVKVIGFHTKKGEPAALIVNCSPYGWSGEIVTKALLRRFGKDYKRVSAK